MYLPMFQLLQEITIDSAENKHLNILGAYCPDLRYRDIVNLNTL